MLDAKARCRGEGSLSRPFLPLILCVVQTLSTPMSSFTSSKCLRGGASLSYAWCCTPSIAAPRQLSICSSRSVRCLSVRTNGGSVVARLQHDCKLSDGGGKQHGADERNKVTRTNVLNTDSDADMPIVRRRYREDRTPWLCMSLRAGGCYDEKCSSYHGSRYYDAVLGLWRTKRMFRQSTARPSHELLSMCSIRSNTGMGEEEARQEDGSQREQHAGTFVLNSAPGMQTGDNVVGKSRDTNDCGSSDDDKGVSSRAAKNLGSWRSMCERCQRPGKVCICSSLPTNPIPIKTRLIILQHPKERKKTTYGTVPIVCLCIEGVHVVTSVCYLPLSSESAHSYTHTYIYINIIFM